MFGPRFFLFRLFGFPVYIDLSWLVIVVLLSWSLAEGLFANLDEVFAVSEAAAEDLRERPGVRWGMGLAGALLLFASVLFHEVGHAKVAERFGVPMKGITLFIFGGVAEMSEDPPSAKAEFWVAVGGPIVTVVIAVLLGALWAVGLQMGWALPVLAVVGYLCLLNVVLLVFNMIPAFPLDGGRVLRAIIWAASGKLMMATRVTTRIGSGFAIFLMLMAVVYLLAGAIFNAVLWFILGMFLRAAAQMSYQRLLARQALEGESLHRFMNKQPVTVTPEVTVEELVDDYVYRHHYKMFPVVEDADEPRLLGSVTVEQVREVPRERWGQTRVGDIYQPVNDQNTVELDKEPIDALTMMHSNQNSRLMVVDGERLVGLISLKDLMDFLSLKIELSERGEI